MTDTSELQKLLAAADRVRRYVEMRDQKPLRAVDDSIHGVHVGTEWEAELTLSDVRAILATISRLTAERAALIEALTPSGDTKAAYIGEIKFSYVQYDEFGDEQTVTRTLEWDTTKEVMAMIRARALVRDAEL